MTRIRLVRMMMLALVVGALVVLITGCSSAPGTPKTTDDLVGTTWTLVRTGGGLKSPAGTTGEDLQKVAWGDGRFVAVGGGGTIVHSVDGETWTGANVSATEDLADVTWGDGRFVAVGGSTIIHSTDGVTWKAASAATEANLSSVTYGADRFVAVAYDGTILYSVNGDHWIEASAPERVVDEEGGRLDGVAWGGNRFVAVGSHHFGRILHSADGDQWTPASDTAIDNWFFVVAHGGTRFIAIAWDAETRTSSIARSADGDSWIETSATAVPGYLRDAAHGTNRFVAVGENGTIVHSADGIQWSKGTTTATAVRLSGVASDGRRFVAVGDNGTIVNSP